MIPLLPEIKYDVSGIGFRFSLVSPSTLLSQGFFGYYSVLNIYRSKYDPIVFNSINRIFHYLKKLFFVIEIFLNWKIFNFDNFLNFFCISFASSFNHEATIQKLSIFKIENMFIFEHTVPLITVLCQTKQIHN